MYSYIYSVLQLWKYQGTVGRIPAGKELISTKKWNKSGSIALSDGNSIRQLIPNVPGTFNYFGALPGGYLIVLPFLFDTHKTLTLQTVLTIIVWTLSSLCYHSNDILKKPKSTSKINLIETWLPVNWLQLTKQQETFGDCRIF